MALPFVINVASSQEDPQKIQVLTLGSALATLPVPVLVGGQIDVLGGLLGSDRPSATVKVGRTNLDERIRSREEHLLKKLDVEER